MQCRSAVVAFLGATLAGASQDEHPIEKVITMLKGLSATAEEEGKSEAVAYDQFEHWCTTSTKTLNAAIAGEKEKIETLTAQIAGEEQLIAQLTKQIGKLEKEISAAEQAQERAQGIRDEGAALYSESSTDHQATIKAIGDAQAALESSRDGGAALTQLPKQVRQALALADVAWPTGAPKAQHAVLTSLLQGLEEPVERPDQLAEGDRAAHVKSFSFKSGDIIELLKALLSRFEDELVALDKAETHSLNAFALETQARDAAIAAAKASKEEKETTKGDTEESLGEHKQAKQDTEDELAADSATLDDTTKSCTIKQQEWETRSKTRALEIEAMGVAIEILAKAGGVRTSAPGNPVPPPAPVEGGAASFLQLANPRQQAVNLLRQKAHTMHSKALARMHRSSRHTWTTPSVK
jgi:chromosome segregation ATPase